MLIYIYMLIVSSLYNGKMLEKNLCYQVNYCKSSNMLYFVKINLFGYYMWIFEFTRKLISLQDYRLQLPYFGSRHIMYLRFSDNFNFKNWPLH